MPLGGANFRQYISHLGKSKCHFDTSQNKKILATGPIHIVSFALVILWNLLYNPLPTVLFNLDKCIFERYSYKSNTSLMLIYILNLMWWATFFLSNPLCHNFNSHNQPVPSTAIPFGISSVSINFGEKIATHSNMMKSLGNTGRPRDSPLGKMSRPIIRV